MEKLIDKLIDQTLHGTGDSDQLAAAIFGIALTTRGKNFLELGVRGGCTTLPLLTAANLLGGKLTSVDIEEYTFMCPYELMGNWHFVNSDAIEFLKNNNQHYDLIFIDDWHDGNHVKKEIELLTPFCDKNTIILLHDAMYGWVNPEYNKADSSHERATELGMAATSEFDNGGVYRAVNDQDKSIWEYATIPFSNGLTILRKH